MECPNCHRDNPNRARTCLYCGAALPHRRRRSVGGGGILAALIVCALVSTVGIRPLQRPEAWPGAAYEEDLRMENPERGAQEQRKDSPLGSAGYLRGDVILVSLYINDDVSEWTAERQANAQSYLSVACSYLEEQAALYGQELDLIYDVTEHPDLQYDLTYDGGIAEDENGWFNPWLNKWIDRNVAIAELQKTYGTENIGFLALVADSGGSYTNVFYVEDSDIYYNESSVIFYYYPYIRTTDREVPAVYAHEILHLFGAIDLYEGSYDFSPENVYYVGQTYPTDIMYSDYTEDGRLVYDSIHLTVGPVTAYCLGWLDELPQADQEGLDEFERTCIAGFSYEDPVFEEDTGKH